MEKVSDVTDLKIFHHKVIINGSFLEISSLICITIAEMVLFLLSYLIIISIARQTRAKACALFWVYAVRI